MSDSDTDSSTLSVGDDLSSTSMSSSTSESSIVNVEADPTSSYDVKGNSILAAEVAGPSGNQAPLDPNIPSAENRNEEILVAIPNPTILSAENRNEEIPVAIPDPTIPSAETGNIEEIPDPTIPSAENRNNEEIPVALPDSTIPSAETGNNEEIPAAIPDPTRPSAEAGNEVIPIFIPEICLPLVNGDCHDSLSSQAEPIHLQLAQGEILLASLHLDEPQEPAQSNSSSEPSEHTPIDEISELSNSGSATTSSSIDIDDYIPEPPPLVISPRDIPLPIMPLPPSSSNSSNSTSTSGSGDRTPKDELDDSPREFKYFPMEEYDLPLDDFDQSPRPEELNISPSDQFDSPRATLVYSGGEELTKKRSPRDTANPSPRKKCEPLPKEKCVPTLKQEAGSSGEKSDSLLGETYYLSLDEAGSFQKQEFDRSAGKFLGDESSFRLSKLQFNNSPKKELDHSPSKESNPFFKEFGPRNEFNPFFKFGPRDGLDPIPEDQEEELDLLPKEKLDPHFS